MRRKTPAKGRFSNNCRKIIITKVITPLCIDEFILLFIFVASFPLCSEEFILLYSYLLEVFRFASEEIPLCSEEFILLYSRLLKFPALQARRYRFVVTILFCYSYLSKVFRFAYRLIPLCSEEFILLFSYLLKVFRLAS